MTESEFEDYVRSVADALRRVYKQDERGGQLAENLYSALAKRTECKKLLVNEAPSESIVAVILKQEKQDYRLVLLEREVDKIKTFLKAAL